MSKDKDYEKYRKYKKMYLELQKNQKNQYGGNDNSISKLNFIVNRTKEEYANLIDRLREHCETKVSTVNQLKEKLSSLYKNIGEEDLSASGIQKIFSEKKYNLQDFNKDLNEYHQKICQYLNDNIIPNLEKEDKLQNDLIDKFNSVAPELKKKGADMNIDLTNYINYAKENNLLDESVNNIIQQYNDSLNKTTAYFNKESLQNQNIMSSLFPATAAAVTASTAKSKSNNVPFINPNGQLSKSGKPCLSKCAPYNDFWHNPLGRFGNETNIGKCEVEPYTSFFMQRNWDLCDIKK